MSITKTVTLALMVSPWLAACVGHMPGSQAAWDDKVTRLCEEDGGVHVYEQVRISRAQYAALPKVGGGVGIPPGKPTANQPVYSIDREVALRSANPKIRKFVRVVRRTSDGKTIGEVVSYSRIGGDGLTIGHPSSFSCPPYEQLYAQLSRFFIVEEEAQ